MIMKAKVVTVGVLVAFALAVVVGVHAGVAFFTNSITAAIHQGVGK